MQNIIKNKDTCLIALQENPDALATFLQSNPRQWDKVADFLRILQPGITAEGVKASHILDAILRSEPTTSTFLKLTGNNIFESLLTRRMSEWREELTASRILRESYQATEADLFPFRPKTQQGKQFTLVAGV
jgi:hypothetical protein